MPSTLVLAQIEGQRRLRLAATTGVTRIWNSLPAHDRANIDQWLSQVLPLMSAAQRQSVALTNAYIARAIERQPLALDVAALTGAGARNGTPPAQVYARPFVTLWSGLKEGKRWNEAAAVALDRATATAAMDVQLSMAQTAQAIGTADPQIQRWQRVADGSACDFCLEVDGAILNSGDALPLHNHCVTGETLVSAPGTLGAMSGPADSTSEAGRLKGAHAVTRRWYEGEIVVLQTALGNELTVTPNHPILTGRGWVAAGLLREGDSVISRRRLDGEHGRVPDKQDMPASIEDHFRARAVSSLTSVPFAPEHFHGDVGQGEVNVVALDSGLDRGSLAALLQPAEKVSLASRLGRAVRLACTCGGFKRCFVSGFPPERSVSSRGSGEALGSRLLRSLDPILFRRRSLFDSRFPQVAVDDGSGYSGAVGNREDGFTGQIGRNDIGHVDASASRQPSPLQFTNERRTADSDNGRRLLAGLAGEVQLDRLVHVRRRGFSAHVFNLVTNSGWYLANGIITHNCGCSVEPLTDSPPVTQLPDTVTVHDHGEMGPLLTDPKQNFMTKAEALARH